MISLFFDNIFFFFFFNKLGFLNVRNLNNKVILEVGSGRGGGLNYIKNNLHPK